MQKIIKKWCNKLTDNNIKYKDKHYNNVMRDLLYNDIKDIKFITSDDIKLSDKLCNYGSIEAYFNEKPIIYTSNAFYKFYYYKFVQEWRGGC